MLPRLLVLLALLLAPAAWAEEGGVTRLHGLSLMGAPGLPADFPNFPYVNPDAPKGGEVALSSVGTFDSFNPFIVRGTPAGAVTQIWDTLLRRNPDEIETAYGHLAKVVELPADRMWVAFELRPEARFHDGHPITADDVVWTFDTLRDHGKPFYRQYWADVSEVVVERPDRVVFHFKSNRNRELPMILGSMPVLPKHWWAGRDFEKPLTDPPLGSGPYKVGRFEFGRSFGLERVKDYWGADLPTAKGLANFDVMRTEYFRDAAVAMEAFKAGHIDYRVENVAKEWATAYDFPAIQRGLVKKEAFAQKLPTGMQGWGMNTRRKNFADRRVREAMAMAFDFQWENANLFYGEYTRTLSFFSNSDLASSGLPGEAELALLEPFRDQLPKEVFTTPFALPVTDGSGNNRDGLRRALALMKEAGWEVKDRRMVNAAGEQLAFEILLDSPTFERVALPYKQWLGRLGIDVTVRTVDAAQYQRRMDQFDFDMTVVVFPESDSPGNEQLGFWTCGSAKMEGSDNLMGVCSKVVDALVDKVINARDRASLVAATRALDRVLLWGWYVVPQWHYGKVRVAWWDRFGRVEQPVRTGVEFNAWWIDPAKSAASEAARSTLN